MSTLIAVPRKNSDVFQPNCPVWQSHPDHLASIARMFGMRPAPIDRCRVLEVGCGAGRNLLPMADRHPHSTFVGVDAIESQINVARQAAGAVGLDNVEFHELKLDQVDDRLGTFDYVICHDVVSRLPRELQDTLFEACRARLNPEGIVYLSYRALPGYSIAGVVREIVRSGSHPEAPAAQEVVRARRSLQMVSKWLAQDASPYARLLKGEVDLAHLLSDASLLHEYFGSESHPFYLHEFVERAAAYDMQCFADADTATMFAERLGPSIEERLGSIAGDEISTLQFVDVLCNRSFRRSLLCPTSAAINRRWSAANLSGLYLAGDLRFDGTDESSGTSPTARFLAAEGSVISTALPAAKVALTHLGETWPSATSFEALHKIVIEKLSAEGNQPAPADEQVRDELCKTLAECIGNTFVQPHYEADSFVTTVSDRPCAGRWTRAEAQAGLSVTNRRHKTVELDEMSSTLLGYLDGQHDRDELLAIAVEAADKGQLSILRSGMPVSHGKATPEILGQVLEQSLSKLARCGLLVA